MFFFGCVDGCGDAGPGCNGELGEDVADVVFDGSGAEVQFGRDLSAGQSGRDEFGYLSFAAGQGGGTGGVAGVALSWNAVWHAAAQPA
jgi:hypothetical protein